ncbi:MAG TPA: zinc-ribbon domain-containing protein [Myxococcales bacterium]
MVVQCPSCQTRFRVADEKVSDRGVRVRCSSCKDVFSVKKSGAAELASSGTSGNTIDLSSLDPPVAPARRGGTGPVGSSSGSSAAKPPRAAPAVGRASPPPPGGKASRLDVDDLFGMDELTGEGARKSAPASAKAKSGIDFDALDLGLEDEPLAPAKPSTGPLASGRPVTSKTKTGPMKQEPAPSRPKTGPVRADESPAPRPKTGPIAPLMKVKTGPLDADGRRKPKTGPVREVGDGSSGLELDERALEKNTGESVDLSLDPFEGTAAGRPAGAGGRPDSKPIEKPRTDKQSKSGKQYKSIFQQPPQPPPSAKRELISSALTGLVGAALAVVVVLVAAVSDEGSAGWLGYTARSDVVATRIVSGLYDTASGKPVFYVRGRVENRGRKPHGPVRVVAELVAGGETEGKAEAIAGAEPSPEDVYALRSAADADRLQRTLLGADAERRLAPGASLPFFAVIADPPTDLQRHRLHLRLEPIDAWSPPRTAEAIK